MEETQKLQTAEYLNKLRAYKDGAYGYKDKSDSRYKMYYLLGKAAEDVDLFMVQERMTEAIISTRWDDLQKIKIISIDTTSDGRLDYVASERDFVSVLFEKCHHESLPQNTLIEVVENNRVVYRKYIFTKFYLLTVVGAAAECAQSNQECRKLRRGRARRTRK